jgi:hypothetical protein
VKVVNSETLSRRVKPVNRYAAKTSVRGRLGDYAPCAVRRQGAFMETRSLAFALHLCR